MIREPIAVRRAVRVGRADQNVLRRNALDPGAGLVAEHGRKTEKIHAHDRHPRVAVRQHQRAHGQVPFLFADRAGRADTARHRQQRIGSDDAHRDAGAKFCRGGRREEKKGIKKEDAF